MNSKILLHMLRILEQEEEKEWGDPNKIMSQMDMHQRAARLDHIQKRKTILAKNLSKKNNLTYYK